uniref:Ovule protein n=1 Tax=Haemonchus placei TaxID=6290 RepID=A0A0N4X9B1_HAEPC
LSPERSSPTPYFPDQTTSGVRTCLVSFQTFLGTDNQAGPLWSNNYLFPNSSFLLVSRFFVHLGVELFYPWVHHFDLRANSSFLLVSRFFDHLGVELFYPWIHHFDLK